MMRAKQRDSWEATEHEVRSLPFFIIPSPNEESPKTNDSGYGWWVLARLADG